MHALKQSSAGHDAVTPPNKAFNLQVERLSSCIDEVGMNVQEVLTRLHGFSRPQKPDEVKQCSNLVAGKSPVEEQLDELIFKVLEIRDHLENFNRHSII